MQAFCTLVSIVISLLKKYGKSIMLYSMCRARMRVCVCVCARVRACVCVGGVRVPA